MTISISNAGAFLKDKDGNVGKVVGLSANDVTLVNNTISSVAGLDTRVTDAVNSITSVKETADAAKTAADAAKTAADAAKTTADEAKSIAANANATANEALTSASSAITRASEVETALQSAKTSINATLLEHEQTITRVDSQLTQTDANVTALKNYDEQLYWPLIEKNHYMVNTVAFEKKDESTGVTTYWPIAATTAITGSVQLMQYDEENPYNNAVVTRALYDALEARVRVLESKSSS